MFVQSRPHRDSSVSYGQHFPRDVYGIGCAGNLITCLGVTQLVSGEAKTEIRETRFSQDPKICRGPGRVCIFLGPCFLQEEVGLHHL